MSILIEALAVVLRVDAIVAHVPGGVPAFAESLPPGTVCSDGELACVSFLDRGHVQRFADDLVRAGFAPCRGGKAIDFVLVDAAQGLLAPCDWAQFAIVRSLVAPLWPIAICKRPGTPVEPVITPEGWDPDRSLSRPPEISLG